MGAGLYVIEMDRPEISVGERPRTVVPGKGQARSGSMLQIRSRCRALGGQLEKAARGPPHAACPGD